MMRKSDLLSSAWVLRLVFMALGFPFCSSFVPIRSLPQETWTWSRASTFGNRLYRQSLPFKWTARRGSRLYADYDEEEDEEIDLSDKDWRAFRAKMVMGEKSTEPKEEPVIVEEGLVDEDDLDGIGAVFGSSPDTVATEKETKESTASSTPSSSATMTPLDPSQWAYDSGKVIEQGAVILGGVEQDYGFGLRQQYFHKTAILVLDHDETQFTKGIILNRPSDLYFEDDVNDGVQWRVWFGGDVQGLNSPNPDIICLHTLKDPTVVEASVTVMNDIQWTSFDNAKRLVQNGVATPDDFWVFCGYAGWGPQQLMGELDRKSWYMVATDSQTLLKELARQSSGCDPRDGGLETWTILMNMIGRAETAEECSGDFDDLVLKEWARENLLSSEAGGGAGIQKRSPGGQSVVLETNSIDQLMQRIAKATSGETVEEGSLVRASSVERSPFLLDNQELHKSVVLIIMDDENISVGAILNRPAAKGLDINILDKTTSKSKDIELPLRFGGQYAIKGSEQLIWIHCNEKLKKAEVGNEIGIGKAGIWKCTGEDVTAAIAQGLAKPEDFLVVSGLSVWPKGEGTLENGMDGQVKQGNFEVIPTSKVQEVWDSLLKQEQLTNMNLFSYVEGANEAWSLGGTGEDSTGGGQGSLPIGGLGEGFDEEDDSLVFNSDVKVAKLSDDALRSWVATFLLGLPSLK